jgi:hypothetical protein
MTVEARDADTELVRSIRRARRSLLAEHLGVSDPLEVEGLVHELDERAAAGVNRLRLHPSPTPQERAVLEVLDPSALPFDPRAPERNDSRLFAGGLGALWRRLSTGS